MGPAVASCAAPPGSWLFLSAPGWGGLQARSLGGRLRARSWPEVGAGRGEQAWSEPARCPNLRGLGFLRVACSIAALLPSPCREHLPPCVLRGRERKGGKSYFSKLLSSSGSSSLPCDSCGGREGWEGLGRSDFPERRAPGASSGCPPSKAQQCLRSPRCVPTPTSVELRSRPARPRCRKSSLEAGPPGGGEKPLKLLCHCPARRSHPGGAARTRATRRGAQGLCFRGALPPGGVRTNLAVQKTGAGRHVKCSDRGSRSRANVEGGSPGCSSRT